MKITSIFSSIDGEVNKFGQGKLTTFVRLAGCNLNCWNGCDTPQAMKQSRGYEISVNGIVQRITDLGISKITITGGEPLLQANEVYQLALPLEKVTIETNGTIVPYTEKEYSHIGWVVDYKLPSTGMESMMNMECYEYLNCFDWIKMVIGNRKDYERAIEVKKEIKSYCKYTPNFAFSPKISGMIKNHQAIDILNWMIEDNLNDVTFNVQIHKLLNLKED